MDNKQYLSEERYQKNKKKLTTVALIILILGLLIGGSLIATGIIKSSKDGNASSNARTEETIQSEIDSLNSELASLKAKQKQEFGNNGFSEEYYHLQNEIETKQSKVSDLKTETWKNKSGFNSTRNFVTKAPFYILGAFIIFASCIISGSIFFFAKRREITAFTAQQVMPVAQEGIEKIAPTIGKAGASIAKEMAPIYGEAAKEIAKGIKEGLKDEKE